jgi:hypothetical protein
MFMAGEVNPITWGFESWAKFDDSYDSFELITAQASTTVPLLNGNTRGLTTQAGCVITVVGVNVPAIPVALTLVAGQVYRFKIKQLYAVVSGDVIALR